MAKYSPYFKFYVSEYNDGDIQLCSLEAQGLFMNLCSIYWSKEGELFLSKAKRLFKVREKVWQELIDECCIKVNEDKISITFLDEQLFEREELSKQNSKNVAKRYEKQTIEPTTVEIGNTPPMQVEYNKEGEKSKEKESKEKVNERETVCTQIFSDEIFIDGLKSTHNGKDLRQAFNECYNHHSNAPNPPTETWQWKQKLNTWLTISPKLKTNGSPKNTDSAEIIPGKRDFKRTW
jgi:hypothetical protein